MGLSSWTEFVYATVFLLCCAQGCPQQALFFTGPCSPLSELGRTLLKLLPVVFCLSLPWPRRCVVASFSLVKSNFSYSRAPLSGPPYKSSETGIQGTSFYSTCSAQGGWASSNRWKGLHLTLSLPCLPRRHCGKRPIKVTNLKSLWLFSPFAWAPERTFVKMHSIEIIFVIGPSNILSASVYVCTFQPGNFTGWGSEGVNKRLNSRI